MVTPRETNLSGKYQLFDRIGAGGMGEVYEAQNLQTERRVAIKFLHAELADNDIIRMRFSREARAAARIDHDNVCEVLDYGISDDGSHYMVMPFLKGKHLSEIIKNESPLEIERACDITRQILSALDAAHSKGVIHRDLKPDNIFLITVGDREDFVKIVDFGLTKFGVGQTLETDATPLTQTGVAMGTPYYMAPEQARGDKDIDGRADLYALGAILYEMLSGKRPVTGDTVNEVLWKLWNAPIQSPKAHRSDLPAELDRFVLKTLARDPDQRFSTAAKMAEALNEALDPSKSDEKNPQTTLETSADIEEIGEKGEKTETEETEKNQAPEGTLLGEEIIAAPQKKSSPRYIIAVLLVAVFGGLIVLYGVSQLDDSGDQHPVTVVLDSDPPEKTIDAATLDEPTPTSDNDGSPSEPDVPEQKAPETVRIVLNGVPRNAKITANGQHIDGTEIVTPKSMNKVQVVINARGYRRWQREIEPSDDTSIEVDLERLVKPGKRRTKRQKPPQNKGFGPVKVFGGTP